MAITRSSGSASSRLFVLIGTRNTKTHQVGKDQRRLARILHRPEITSRPGPSIDLLSSKEVLLQRAQTRQVFSAYPTCHSMYGRGTDHPLPPTPFRPDFPLVQDLVPRPQQVQSGRNIEKR